MYNNINNFKNFQKNMSRWNENYSQDEISDNKNIILRTLLDRSNEMLNMHDIIDWSDSNILKIKLSYLDYGEGTRILPFLNHKSFYYEYWIDFKNKKLISKNFLGVEYDINSEDIEDIKSKYIWMTPYFNNRQPKRY